MACPIWAAWAAWAAWAVSKSDRSANTLEEGPGGAILRGFFHSNSRNNPSACALAQSKEKNPMKLPQNAHVAVVDGETFLLFRNEGALFEPKLKKEDSPKLDVTNFSAAVRKQDDVGQNLGRTDLDELGHAAAATEWLNARAVANDLHDVLIIADPKSLGEMRRHYHSELEKRVVGEIDKTLTGQPVDKIEQAIVAAE
ncbi:MAG: host attachment protein [Erythrobacter sp.]